MKFKQCKFQNESSFTIGWIPEEYAVVGNRVTIKDSEDTKKLWGIIEVYEPVKERLVEGVDIFSVTCLGGR